MPKRLTFCHMPWIKLMYDVRILLSHQFCDGWMSIRCDHFDVNAFIQELLQPFPETHWFHCYGTRGLGRLEGTSLQIMTF